MKAQHPVAATPKMTIMGYVEMSDNQLFEKDLLNLSLMAWEDDDCMRRVVVAAVAAVLVKAINNKT